MPYERKVGLSQNPYEDHYFKLLENVTGRDGAVTSALLPTQNQSCKSGQNHHRRKSIHL